MSHQPSGKTWELMAISFLEWNAETRLKKPKRFIFPYVSVPNSSKKYRVWGRVFWNRSNLNECNGDVTPTDAGFGVFDDFPTPSQVFGSFAIMLVNSCIALKQSARDAGGPLA